MAALDEATRCGRPNLDQLLGPPPGTPGVMDDLAAIFFCGLRKWETWFGRLEKRGILVQAEGPILAFCKGRDDPGGYRAVQ